MKSISILGSTGSIGTQTLDIIRKNKDSFVVSSLVARNNFNLLIEQAKEFRPRYVVIANDIYYDKVKTALAGLPICVLSGEDAIIDVAGSKDVDIVLTAMVGISGLKPTIKAIESNKKIALANKETLVVAGEFIKNLQIKNKTKIYPVDSEHSAIYQCLCGDNKYVEKVILTASGGPFRNFTKKEMENVTKSQALKHPNWSMGAKVTIDSATMMNKGLEMIEARWLFDIHHDDIDIVVHPESIIHSLVCYKDGSYKAQLGVPDMRIPISYAIGEGDRIPNDLGRLDFSSLGSLTFQKPDVNIFPNIKTAYDAIAQGGSATTVMNAANEIAVEYFLNDKIRFFDISYIISDIMNSYNHISSISSISEYIHIDNDVRTLTKELINRKYLI